MSYELLQSLFSSINKVKESIIKLQKYKSNVHYKKIYETDIKNLNREYTFFKEKIKKISKDSLHTKIKEVDSLVHNIMNQHILDKKMSSIEKLELLWPQLEIEFMDYKSFSNTFEIPKEIPMNEQRLDLEEAIRDFNNGCYISSLVLCRRAYEGALAETYKLVTHGTPIEDVLCPHCNKKIRGQSYMGIGKLHSWAIKNKIISEKLKQVGFLISDIGAGGAHPPLEEFPRDLEIAKLGITATVTLLKQIYAKKR